MTNNKKQKIGYKEKKNEKKMFIRDRIESQNDDQDFLV
jgi:hypothetical protein